MRGIRALLLVVLMGLLLAGLFVAFFISVPRTEENSICPPAIDEAVRFRLFYAEKPDELGTEDTWPPEFTERDREFVEACGFDDISPPVRIEPKEKGA